MHFPAWSSRNDRLQKDFLLKSSPLLINMISVLAFTIVFLLSFHPRVNSGRFMPSTALSSERKLRHFPGKVNVLKRKPDESITRCWRQTGLEVYDLSTQSGTFCLPLQCFCFIHYAELAMEIFGYAFVTFPRELNLKFFAHQLAVLTPADVDNASTSVIVSASSQSEILNLGKCLLDWSCFLLGKRTAKKLGAAQTKG